MNAGSSGSGGLCPPVGYQGTSGPDSNAPGARSNAFERSSARGEAQAHPLSREKLALVHVARRDLGLEDDIYRATLADVAGVSSAKSLTEAQFRAVMVQFERMGYQPRKHFGERPGFATQKQLDYIRGLFGRWLGRDDEAALTKWIEKRYHVSALRFLDVTRAQKAIEGLKRMVERKLYAESIGEYERNKATRKVQGEQS